MNRRAFLAAVFGSAVASALPQAQPVTTIGWGPGRALLQPGDTFTIAAVNRVNPTRYRVMKNYEFAFHEDCFVLSWPRLEG